MLYHLKRVLTKLGLKGRLHTFRHSFISHALIEGVPEAVVREWVGHVDPHILKLYTHVAGQDSRAYMDKLFMASPTSLAKSSDVPAPDATSVDRPAGDHEYALEAPIN